MAMATVELPNLHKMESDGQYAITEAKKFICKTQQEYLNCMDFFKWLKARKKDIRKEPEFVDLIAKKDLLHKLHADASALEKKILKPYDDAETIIENAMRPYVIEQMRKEDEEKKRLQIEADKKSQEEKELALLEAQIDGRTAEAAVIEQMAPVTKEVKVESLVSKVEGTRTRPKFKWEVVDESLIPDEYWILNDAKIGAAVNKLGENCGIPGIKVIQDVSFVG